MLRTLAAAIALLAVEHIGRAAPCEGPITPDGAVRCSLAASLDVRLAREELRALHGRRVAAGIRLPANPSLSFSAAARTGEDAAGATVTVFDWYLTLSQEIEIAGQRGTRVAVVDAERDAAVRRIAVAEQDAIADALLAWLEVRASDELVAIAGDADAVASSLALVAEGKLSEALVSAVDADLAAAEAVRFRVARTDAERRRVEAGVTLATLLARDPTRPIAIAGDCTPAVDANDASRLVDRALLLRGEVAAAELERAAAERHVTALRRARAPNLTLQLNAQSDGFNERVLGGGVSMPLPLPAPLGHVNTGEIAEARARVDQALTTVEQVRRRVRAEVASSALALAARERAAAAFAPALVERARHDLRLLGEAIAGRQMSLRDALLAQRSLLDLLRGDVEARLARDRARVELLRAVGALGGAR